MRRTLAELKDRFPFERISPAECQFRVGLGERVEM
jgi:hypothetical protein